MATIKGTGRLLSKIAIVTGSSAGIGRSIAIRYAAEGAYVVCSDLRPEAAAGKPTHEFINESYPGESSKQRSIFVKADVSKSAEFQNLIQECVKAFGRLDIMVNNAGIAVDSMRPANLRIHEVPEAAYDKVVGVNLKGVWLGCKYAITQMLAQPPHSSGDRGWIVNTASILGFVGFAGLSEYSASKGGVVNLTRTLAAEYGADRIHINGIAPGFIKTAMTEQFRDPAQQAAAEALIQKHPLGPRLGEPDELAGAAVFLASDDASFVTGHTVVVDGGYIAV